MCLIEEINHWNKRSTTKIFFSCDKEEKGFSLLMVPVTLLPLKQQQQWFSSVQIHNAEAF